MFKREGERETDRGGGRKKRERQGEFKWLLKLSDGLKKKQKNIVEAFFDLQRAHTNIKTMVSNLPINCILHVGVRETRRERGK